MIAHVVCAPLFVQRLAYYAIFLVLLFSAVNKCCCFLPRLLPCRVIVFLSFCFFRACVASVRYDMFVWQEGEDMNVFERWLHT